MENETKKRLREIASKSAMQLTKEDKAFIKDMSAELNLPLKKACPNCYIDQAAILWRAIGSEAKDTTHYVLRDGVDVYFGNTRINDATLTDELAKKVIERGFDRRYFANIPDEGSND